MYGHSVQPELFETAEMGSRTSEASVILPATVGLVAVPYPGSPPEALVARKCELASRIGSAVVIDRKLPVVADAESMLAEKVKSLRSIERNAARVRVVWLQEAKPLSVECSRLQER